MPAHTLPSIPGAPPAATHTPIRLAALQFETPAPPSNPTPPSTTSTPASASTSAPPSPEPTAPAPAHPTSATPPPTHPTPLIPGLPADHRAIRHKITHEKLLEEFLHADIHLPDFARNHFLSLADLAAWHDAPQTQADLATYRRIAHSQARAVRALARPEALARLTSQLRSQDFDERHQHLDPNNPKDRALALRQRESARRAATTLLARSKPRRSTKRPRRVNTSAATNATTSPAHTSQPHTNQARDAQAPTDQKPTSQAQAAPTQQPFPVASIPAESQVPQPQTPQAQTAEPTTPHASGIGQPDSVDRSAGAIDTAAAVPRRADSGPSHSDGHDATGHKLKRPAEVAGRA